MVGAPLFSGGGFSEILNNLQNAGFFSYIIPFLLIFALVFGILSRMNLFKENRAVTSIIALAVGLMAIQMDLVPRFFSEIFPRFGIAISIILTLLIILGLFLDPEKPGIMYALLGVAAIIVIVVLAQTAGEFGITLIGPWLRYNWGNILMVVLVAAGVVGGLVAIINSGKKKTKEKGNPASYTPYLIRVPTDGQ